MGWLCYVTHNFLSLTSYSYVLHPIVTDERFWLTLLANIQHKEHKEHLLCVESDVQLYMYFFVWVIL